MLIRKQFLLNCVLLFAFVQTNAQTSDTIKVHFLYGSKPAKGHKNHESKWFGGIHGGHVTIEIDKRAYGFGPVGRFHIVGHRKACHSSFSSASTANWEKDTSGMNYTSFVIPVDSITKQNMLATLKAYMEKTPYDYAFIGMRCAAATGDVLGQHGIIKKRSRKGNTYKFFYPRKLRKHLFKLSENEDWIIERNRGKSSRKWEKDPKKYRQE